MKPVDSTMFVNKIVSMNFKSYHEAEAFVINSHVPNSTIPRTFICSVLTKLKNYFKKGD